MKAAFEIVADGAGGYRWRPLDSNGEEIAVAGASRPDTRAAAAALDRVRFLSQMLSDPVEPSTVVPAEFGLYALAAALRFGASTAGLRAESARPRRHHEPGLRWLQRSPGAP